MKKHINCLLALTTAIFILSATHTDISYGEEYRVAEVDIINAEDQILPTETQTDIQGEERSWIQIQEHEKIHPVPPILLELPFRSSDPEYKQKKETLADKVRQQTKSHGKRNQE